MKRTKKITAALKAIAKGLPKHEYTYYDTLSESGADLIQRGITEDSDKKLILPHKTYMRRIPVKGEVNHENRVKSAYDSGGVDGVKKYLTEFVKPELRAEFFKRLQITLG